VQQKNFFGMPRILLLRIITLVMIVVNWCDCSSTVIDNNTTTIASSSSSSSSSSGEGNAWDQALNEIFSMASHANPVSNNEACVSSIRDLMTRQQIPHSLHELKMLNDVQLYKMAILASVARISRWTRDKNNVAQFLITENGRLLHPYSPGAVESDVMLCIICVLLTVIATFHLITPSNNNNNINTGKS